MLKSEDDISYNAAATLAEVHRNTIIDWVKKGLLSTDTLADHPVLDRNELNSLLDVRATNPRDWRRSWKAQKEKRNG